MVINLPAMDSRSVMLFILSSAKITTRRQCCKLCTSKWIYICICNQAPPSYQCHLQAIMPVTTSLMNSATIWNQCLATLQCRRTTQSPGLNPAIWMFFLVPNKSSSLPRHNLMRHPCPRRSTPHRDMSQALRFRAILHWRIPQFIRCIQRGRLDRR